MSRLQAFGVPGSVKFLAIAAVIVWASGCQSSEKAAGWNAVDTGLAVARQRQQREYLTSTAPARTAASPRRVTIVVDIDETISATDYSGFFGLRENNSHPYDHAREVLTRLSGDFDIIYLTARPQWLFAETRAWLREAGFPRGPVVATGRIVDVFWPASFKTRSLALLRLRVPEILIGIGDRKTDVAAYSANGMLSLVVHPRAGMAYPGSAVVLEDWKAVGQFFDEHGDVLRDPAALRSRFGIAGDRLDPTSVHTRADVDLSLLIELPLAAPALLLEPLVKMGAIFEQLEARPALQTVEVSFEQVLAGAVNKYGDENLLKIQLGMQSGRPAYKVYFVRQGQVRRLMVDGLTGEFGRDRRLFSSMRDSLNARPHAAITFAHALACALEELDGHPYELELEMDDGQPTYEVAMETHGQFVEVELHAATGEILEVESETAVR